MRAGRCLIFCLGVLLMINPAVAQKLLKAKADLIKTDGEKAGAVYFEEKDMLVKITVNITDLEPGMKALHIHEKGQCDAPDFESAGGHFNPFHAEHGFLNPHGPHAGDLPNFEVSKDGTATVTFLTKRVTLQEEEMNSLLKEGRTAVVIHEKPDDYVTDPTGNAGGRIACGVIKSMKSQKQ